MIDFTVFETNLKKAETLPSNNQHCNEKTTNRRNWTMFATARNPGNKKVYPAKWKKNSGINMIDLQCLKKKTEALPSNNQHCIEKKKQKNPLKLNNVCSCNE